MPDSLILADAPPRATWQLDKRIPVIPALLLIVQTLSLVWYAAKLDARIESVERWIAVNANTQITLTEMKADLRNHEQRLSRMEGVK